MKIAGREIGYDHPPYIVAEISANHSGSLQQAYNLIEAAQWAGADAVKIQTYTPQELTTDPELTKLYEKAQTPRDWHKSLFTHAHNCGITLFSSPFSVDAVEFLEQFDPPAYKIASPEALRWDIVGAVSNAGRPVIVSTGALSEWDQIFVLANQFADAVFLHCIAQYPAKVRDANLNAIRKLRMAHGSLLIGLSDHTPGFIAPVAATALGAVMIEKHIKLDDNCIDSEWSLDPKEFKAMCRAVRDVYHGMGDGQIRATCKPRQL